MKNVPYVKMFDENGNLTNPITTGYIHDWPNRQERRLHKNRFFGNGKNFPLTITKASKHLRSVQHEYDKEGEHKIIYHYLPR